MCLIRNRVLTSVAGADDRGQPLDNKARRWWDDLYELCPDDLLAELNGGADPAMITAHMKRYRALKR